jgi:ribosomal protein S12
MSFVFASRVLIPKSKIIGPTVATMATMPTMAANITHAFAMTARRLSLPNSGINRVCCIQLGNNKVNLAFKPHESWYRCAPLPPQFPH